MLPFCGLLSSGRSALVSVARRLFLPPRLLASRGAEFPMCMIGQCARQQQTACVRQGSCSTL